MSKLAIFIHYKEEGDIPKNVQYYLDEIRKYFDNIIFITNKREISNISDFYNNDILEFDNEGYDFGSLYKALNTIDYSIYSHIGVFNDSNIILNPLNEIFNWGFNSGNNFWGITDCYLTNVMNDYKYHIQSHFMIFDKITVKYFYDYLNDTKIYNYFNVDIPIRDLRLKIIDLYEIGFTQYLLTKEVKIEAYYKSNIRNPLNMHIDEWDKLIEQGYPFIKKKIVYNTFDKIYEKPTYLMFKDINIIEFLKNKNIKYAIE